MDCLQFGRTIQATTVSLMLTGSDSDFSSEKKNAGFNVEHVAEAWLLGFTLICSHLTRKADARNASTSTRLAARNRATDLCLTDNLKSPNLKLPIK